MTFFDYVTFLMRKSQHANPRKTEEDLASVLDLRNYDCLLVWRNKWHSRRSYPAIWDGYTARFFSLYLEKETVKAKGWLEAMFANQMKAKARNVLTLKGVVNKRIR